MTRTHLIPLSLLPLVTALAACKPKDCDAVLSAAGKARASLVELELTAAKVELDALAATHAHSGTAEISYLAQTAQGLSESIVEMQRRDATDEERQLILASFEYRRDSFLSGLRTAHDACE